MAKSNHNIILDQLSGHIGKQLVVKQYAHGTVVSKFPDMSHIKPSRKQKEKRNLFKEAVMYAQAIIRNPVKKAAYQKKLKNGQTVYHFALKEYLEMSKSKPV